ncbi:MAG: SDR family oxidoreductase [Thaumarchaeota archaeon]|nr:MAG: SDR family oxidoreductase [Nitrososphaerota archaeon]
MVSYSKVAVVTGSSSGIGLETALLLAENGFKTYATMRNVNKASNVLEKAQRKNLPIEVLELDVNSDESVHQAVEKIVKAEGRIDLLVNNAGYGLIGAVEDLSTDEVKEQYETNVFGVFRTIREVLPTMRKQHGGTIINISSIAGVIGFVGMGAYVSTKFAIEGLTQSLRLELAPFGIRALVIEPGVIRTNILNSSPVAKRAQSENSAYKEMMERFHQAIGAMVKNASEPIVVANQVLRAATEIQPRIRYPAGPDAEMILSARKQKTDEELEEFMTKMIGEQPAREVRK